MFEWLTQWWRKPDENEETGEESGDEDETSLANKIGLFYIQFFQKLLIPAHVRESKYVTKNPYHRIFYNNPNNTSSNNNKNNNNSSVRRA